MVVARDEGLVEGGRVKRCPTGKHTHPSKGAAEAAPRSVLKIKPDYSGQVYPCGRCAGWHFGLRKKNAHRNKYR